jgi:Na+-translocating ferredoxin:NAD+ oxidoreductase RnfC subunit
MRYGEIDHMRAEIARLKAELDDAECRLRAEVAEYQRRLTQERAEHVQTETWAKHCEEHVQAATAPLEAVRKLIEEYDSWTGAALQNGMRPRDALLIDQIRAAVEIPSVEGEDADQNSEE